jgi:RNA polymerase sigma factor (sigma-70 family)
LARNFRAARLSRLSDPLSDLPMEAGALHPPAGGLTAIAGRSPLLRLQSDERLIALIRKGHHGAFEALVQRYQSRLLAFCRHMLGSTEDAEDVLQEVFAAAYNAICADERAINARPWLYRIARNRCLNHLRRPVPSGQDSMDVFERDGGQTTADAVHKREEFRQIVADVQDLPETQRTALLLREIDALSYDHIALAMDTTVPSVKSLLVRARVSLAEAAEARLLTCDEVRIELGEVAEGLAKSSAPVRRHLKSCERCRTFRRELRRTNRALAAIYPVGPLVLVKKVLLAKLSAGGASGSGAAAAGGASTASGALTAGIGALATKAVAGVAAAALVTAGAVEVRQSTSTPSRRGTATAVPHAGAAPVVISSAPEAHQGSGVGHDLAAADPVKTSANSAAQNQPAAAKHKADKKPAKATESAAQTPTTAPATTQAQQPATTPSSQPQPLATAPVATRPPAPEHDGSTVTIGPGSNGTASGSGSSDPSSSGGDSSTTQQPSDNGSSSSSSPPPSNGG